MDRWIDDCLPDVCQIFASSQHLKVGASIKYVRTEGEGVSKKTENMRTIALIGCVKSVKRGEGVKKAGKFAYAYVLNGCSLTHLTEYVRSGEKYFQILS